MLGQRGFSLRDPGRALPAHGVGLRTLVISGGYLTELFYGERLAGIWKLEITDSANNSPHHLTSWSLKVWDQDDVPPVIEAPTATHGADVE